MAKKITIPSQQEISSMSDKQISKALARFKPLATSRISNIIKRGKQSYLKDISNTLKPLSDNRSELSNIIAFLRKPFSKVSTIQKFERDMVKIMNANGYYGINENNISEFNSFMAEVRAMHKGRRIPDSTRVVQVFMESQRLKMSNKAMLSNLKYWKNHLDDLAKLKSSSAKTKYSANYIKNRIAKYK